MDIHELRNQIDNIDEQIVKLFSQRMQIAQQIGAYKKVNHLPTLDPSREAIKLQEIAKISDPQIKQYTIELYKVLFQLSKDYQNSTTNCQDTEVAE